MSSEGDNQALVLEALCGSAAPGNGLNFLVAFL